MDPDIRLLELFSHLKITAKVKSSQLPEHHADARAPSIRHRAKNRIRNPIPFVPVPFPLRAIALSPSAREPPLSRVYRPLIDRRSECRFQVTQPVTQFHAAIDLESAGFMARPQKMSEVISGGFTPPVLRDREEASADKPPKSQPSPRRRPACSPQTAAAHFISGRSGAIPKITRRTRALVPHWPNSNSDKTEDIHRSVESPRMSSGGPRRQLEGKQIVSEALGERGIRAAVFGSED
ncbi:hypothetical protein EYF80_026868 [Liparis tanakae]|uniref:Uncharacterized protein n=1 Tax=Liparis tanakae TaxID=230148 RepID=A0A4Z2HAX5_9TELE|nr:hypothetical protein EYF80_026868 [Liparis tanakae]